VDAPVVFLDEFSTGMDPILKRSMMAALREQAKRGRTIVLTTQILSEAEELCDDILILNQGREIARGDLHALKLLTQNVYEVTMTFDQLPDGLESELAARQPLRLSVAQNTVAVALKEDETRVLSLVSELARRGRVLRVEVNGASLEDVFVELTTQGGRT
jgi:ABC-2 type transport system ATP-binding protein